MRAQFSTGIDGTLTGFYFPELLAQHRAPFGPFYGVISLVALCSPVQTDFLFYPELVFL